MFPIKVKEKIIDGERYIHFNNDFDRIRYFYSTLINLLLIVALIGLGVIFGYMIWANIDILKSTPCEECIKHGYYCFRDVGG